MSDTIPIRRGRITGSVALNLSGYVEVKRHPVESVVAEQWGVDPQLLHSRDRHEPIASARFAALSLMVEYGMSPDCAASHFGRERSLAHYVLSKTKDREAIDMVFHRKMNASRSALGL